MSVSEIYDQFVSDHFDKDPFQIYRDSRQQALQQIQRQGEASIKSILDLGFGTGDLLIALQDLFPTATLSGIDSSSKMIETAKSKFSPDRFKKNPVSLFHDDVHNIGNYFGHESADLITMHFVMNYIDPLNILSKARLLLKPGGIFSITTATEESFATLRILAGNLWAEEIIRAETRSIKNTDTLKMMLKEVGFEIFEEETLIKEICFKDVKSLRDFSFHAGWCTSKFLFNLREEQLKMYEEIAQTFLPIHDAVKVAIVLAGKI